MNDRVKDKSDVEEIATPVTAVAEEMVAGDNG